LRGTAGWARQAAVQGEVERILAIRDPVDKMEAFAELSRVLAEEGETPSRAATDRILRSLNPDAEAAVREERRRAYLVRRAEEERLERWRPWAAWAGVPAAATLPVAATMGASGWSPLDALLAALEVPWMLGAPVLVAAVALCGAGFAAWVAGRAPSRNALLQTIGVGFACGVLLVFMARELPVYRAGQGAALADGSPIGGAIVRVERLWPAAPDRLHVLRGSGRMARGTVLAIEGGRPVAYLRGGAP